MKSQLEQTNLLKINNSILSLLFAQIVLLIEGLKQAQHYFNKTNESFDKIYNRLISGRGNLMDKAEKVRQLGAKVKRKLPDSMETAANKTKEDIESLLEKNTKLK